MFETECLGFGVERDIRFQFPGTMFGSVSQNISMMFSNTLAKVFGRADVEMARNSERFENKRSA